MSENQTRLRENARLDMQRYEAKKAYDRNCELSVSGGQTSLISGANDPITTKEQKRRCVYNSGSCEHHECPLTLTLTLRYHSELERQEAHQKMLKAQEEEERCELRSPFLSAGAAS